MFFILLICAMGFSSSQPSSKGGFWHHMQIRFTIQKAFKMTMTLQWHRQLDAAMWQFNCLCRRHSRRLFLPSRRWCLDHQRGARCKEDWCSWRACNASSPPLEAGCRSIRWLKQLLWLFVLIVASLKMVTFILFGCLSLDWMTDTRHSSITIAAETTGLLMIAAVNFLQCPLSAIANIQRVWIFCHCRIFKQRTSTTAITKTDDKANGTFISAAKSVILETATITTCAAGGSLQRRLHRWTSLALDNGRTRLTCKLWDFFNDFSWSQILHRTARCQVFQFTTTVRLWCM